MLSFAAGYLDRGRRPGEINTKGPIERILIPLGVSEIPYLIFLGMNHILCVE